MDWISAVSGLFGVALGAFLEPLKHRFAAGARRRDQRAERCADLVSAAREVLDPLTEYVAVHDLAKERGGASDGGGARRRQLMDDARRAHPRLLRASALVELVGPTDLAAAAWALREAERAIMLDPPRRQAEYTAALTTFEGRLDAFITEAQRQAGDRTPRRLRGRRS